MTVRDAGSRRKATSWVAQTCVCTPQKSVPSGVRRSARMPQAPERQESQLISVQTLCLSDRGHQARRNSGRGDGGPDAVNPTAPGNACPGSAIGRRRRADFRFSPATDDPPTTLLTLTGLSHGDLSRCSKGREDGASEFFRTILDETRSKRVGSWGIPALNAAMKMAAIGPFSNPRCRGHPRSGKSLLRAISFWRPSYRDVRWLRRLCLDES